MMEGSTGGRVGRPPKGTEERRPVTMFLPTAIITGIDRAADARGTSRQALVAEICRQWLAQQERQRQ